MVSLAAWQAENAANADRAAAEAQAIASAVAPHQRALLDVAAERQRQLRAEGWTPEHDDAHDAGQLAGAAACYSLTAVAHWGAGPAIDHLWPWARSWWKPKDKRRNLVKAAALLVAEIERLDRAAAHQSEPVA